ncbi:MAG: GFA family protein, partial [Xanthomonadales bacterium]|nr:GFA family protein [Xanthomonadales bacterium]
VTWVGFEQDRFHLDRGDGELRWFESSPGASRGFCTACGSSMFFRSERWSGELHAALASLDDAIDRAPQAHAFHDSHVDWMPFDETLKIFRG